MVKYLSSLEGTNNTVIVERDVETGHYVVTVQEPSRLQGFEYDVVAKRMLDKNATEEELDKLVESLVTYVPDLTGTYCGEEY